MAVTTTEKPQHLRALDNANRIRLGAAAIKRDVRAGRRRVIDLLDPESTLPEVIGSLTIMQLLTAQHRWGRTRARRVLNHVEIHEGRRLDALTYRQRRKLVVALAELQARPQAKEPIPA